MGIAILPPIQQNLYHHHHGEPRLSLPGKSHHRSDSQPPRVICRGDIFVPFSLLYGHGESLKPHVNLPNHNSGPMGEAASRIVKKIVCHLIAHLKYYVHNTMEGATHLQIVEALPVETLPNMEETPGRFPDEFIL